jgi:hypothetical protein
MNGYAFEIAEPAAGRLLALAVPAAFTHDLLTVCRKDSTEITLEDRQVRRLLHPQREPLETPMLFD